MIRSFLSRCSLLLSLLLMAQTSMAQQTVEMADQLRADGKIWVVVTVVAVVFFGIILYLVRLDGQIGKLEREVKGNQRKAGQTTTNLSR
ncbi:CcmD family protein [Fibrella arboris]|uniref:CcmD family protein n=1 Tax=Fibrella arboris TaxID=3242486 RepID=UPI00351FEEB6